MQANNNNYLIHSTTQNNKGTWITDYTWITGVVGALTIIVCAVWFNVTNTLNTGINLFGWDLTDNATDSKLAALFITTGVMLFSEIIRLWFWQQSHFFSIAPNLKQGKYFSFLVECLKNYLLYLILLWSTLQFFHTAGEYGFKRTAPYYQSWFRLLDIVWSGYLWGGLPYVLITRGLKHDSESDRRDLGNFVGKIVRFGWSLLPLFKHDKVKFDRQDQKTALGILVKLFFTPLMTVFFADQFPHLVNNVGYLGGLIYDSHYTHVRFNKVFFNISIAFIFSVDVALAWCGYVVSSHWVDNQTHSAEPSLRGWMVCVICYPPLQFFLGLYYAAPGEREILRFGNEWLVTLFTTMMVMSYFVYMSATLWFGVRFSNLTNRGIIRKGPFAIIRHPAYASKNFAWWCVMFPAIIFNATHTGMELAITQTVGLVLMTGVYYLRAITEEQHINADPMYQEYCKQVRYRFIPGLV